MNKPRTHAHRGAKELVSKELLGSHWSQNHSEVRWSRQNEGDSSRAIGGVQELALGAETPKRRLSPESAK